MHACMCIIRVVCGGHGRCRSCFLCLPRVPLSILPCAFVRALYFVCFGLCFLFYLRFFLPLPMTFVDPRHHFVSDNLDNLNDIGMFSQGGGVWSGGSVMREGWPEWMVAGSAI